MNLKQKIDRRFEELESSGFQEFALKIEKLFMFLRSNSFFNQLEHKLLVQYPEIGFNVSNFLSSRIKIEIHSQEESAAVAFEMLRRLAIVSSDIGKVRGILRDGIFPIELNIYDYPNDQNGIDAKYLSIFKAKYFDEFTNYIEEKVEEYEMANKANVNSEERSTALIQNFHAPVGSVLTGNHNISNVNQNIGQNFSEILEQLAKLKREFQTLPEGDREEAIEVIDALEVEVQSETPSKGKVKSFLSSVKDFAVKTGTDATSKIVVELIKSQMGI